MVDRLRSELVKDFSRKRARNPQFSLRAYSRQLEISPTTLSLIMNGKRQISRKLASKLVNRLEVSPRTADEVLEYVSDRRSDFTELDLDTLRMMADWHYFAILSIMETVDFESDAQWIAQRLGLSVTIVEQAISVLVKLGYICFDQTGQMVGTDLQLKTPDGLISLAIRASHLQAFDLAKKSLREDSIELRNMSAMTIAIDPNKLPEAAERIKKFRRKLSQYLSTGTKKDVYRLCIQLFPLSRSKTHLDIGGQSIEVDARPNE